MDKEIRGLLHRAAESGRQPFWQNTVESARSASTLMKALFGEAPAVKEISYIGVQTTDGILSARLYRPNDDVRGLVVFFHGGGWVIGSVDDYHPFTATLAERTGFAVLSVEYRLAPEYPFPHPVKDAVAAIDFASKEAVRILGKQPDVLVVMGNSAGGTLATVAAGMHNRSAGIVRPVDLQIMAYPVTDANFDTESYREFESGYLLTRRDMQWFWQHYCPDLSLRTDPAASPLRQSNLVGHPPALILTGGLDPLRDEGEAYGRLLAEAGIPAETVRCESLPHGFLAMINFASSAAHAFERIVRAIVNAKPRTLRES